MFQIESYLFMSQLSYGMVGCFFGQYRKNKKHKYKVKLYELCESGGMVLKMKVYCGKLEWNQLNIIWGKL